MRNTASTRRRRRLVLAAPLLGLAFVRPVPSESARPRVASTVTITESGATAGTSTSALYLTLRATVDDRLASVSTDVGEATLHRSEIRDGLATMKDVETFALPAGENVVFHPGGSHIMIQPLGRTLVVGDRITVTFRFAEAPDATLMVAVESMAQTARRASVVAVPAEGASEKKPSKWVVPLVGGVVALLLIVLGGAWLRRYEDRDRRSPHVPMPGSAPDTP